MFRFFWCNSDSLVGTERASAVDEGRSARTPGGLSEEARIYRLAARFGGRLTVSDVVVEIGWSASDAEALLEHMTDSIHVRMEILDDGRVSYEFPELSRNRGRNAEGEISRIVQFAREEPS